MPLTRGLLGALMVSSRGRCGWFVMTELSIPPGGFDAALPETDAT